MWALGPNCSIYDLEYPAIHTREGCDPPNCPGCGAPTCTSEAVDSYYSFNCECGARFAFRYSGEGCVPANCPECGAPTC